jgi:hypothetical protein
VTRAGRTAAAPTAIRRRDGDIIEVLTGSVGDPLGDVQSGIPVVWLAAPGVEHGYRALDLPGAPI